MGDILVKAILNGEIAVCACDVSQMVEEARVTHDMMPVATIILGRTIAAATMMSSLLKNKEDRMTLMINGGGPAGTIMAVGNAALEIKAYIANPDVNPPPNEQGAFDVGGAVGTTGMLTVIQDLGLGEPYIGKVKMQTGEIGEDIAHYFLVSEQQPSLVYVNTWLETDMSVVNAGGILIRPLPNCSEETLLEVEKRVPQIANYALYLMEYGVEGVLKKLFQGMELKLLDNMHPVYQCDCNRDRLKQVIISLGAEEVQDMIEKDGGAHITCHFCTKEYNFSSYELSELLEN